VGAAALDQLILGCVTLLLLQCDDVGTLIEDETARVCRNILGRMQRLSCCNQKLKVASICPSRLVAVNLVVTWPKLEEPSEVVGKGD